MQVQYNIESSNDNIPMSYDLTNTVPMDFWDLDDEYGNSPNLICKDIATGDQMEKQDLQHGPIIAILQVTQQNWSSNINTIVEETVYDVKTDNGNSTIKDTNISSGKKCWLC